MTTHSTIECLEARIAPAGIYHFTDVDGDLVTVKSSKGTSAQLMAKIAPAQLPFTALGTQLGNVSFNAAVFDGADISITARPQDVNLDGIVDGDGFVNVGSIDSSIYKLGNVVVDGDLGRITGGTAGKTTQLKSLTVHSLGVLGPVNLFADLISTIHGNVGKLVVKGDMQNASFFAARLGSVSIGGSIFSGRIEGSDAIGPVHVNGSVSDSVIVSFASIGQLKVGGSVLDSSIVAGTNLGPVVIKGSFIGTAGDPAKIYAHGLAGDPLKNNIAIKSISIGGRVEQAYIFGGVSLGGAADNGNAQIGAVSVGGDWIASSMESGCTSTDGFLGDANDAAFGVGTHSRIASIVIKGQVFGEVGTDHTFGFFAESIGSFKSGGATLSLKAGARNDTFALGRALPVGTTLTAAGAFTVHVFEV